MTTATSMTHAHSLEQVWDRARSDPAYGAFLLMRIGYAVLPIWMGADKFANSMTYWPHYLAPWIVGLLPFSAETAMHVVGVIEIVAGIAVAIKPRYASYIVTLWLAGIIINLLTYSGFYDVALRDFGLLLGALTLARLASMYDPAWFTPHLPTSTTANAR
ncbi:MAG TPA: DoxX family protein [Nocardioidaceae bacterium]|nr:DoxX family protein [Nocardioidaceae bacterium]